GAEERFWSVPPGDPGPERLLASAVYTRGAMTLHALRRTVGDEVFFEILRTWPAEHRDGNATTDDFVALSERIAGRPLRPLFDDWLYGTVRPAYPAARAGRRGRGRRAAPRIAGPHRPAVDGPRGGLIEDYAVVP